jgi:nicotinate-nucleotide pyrophosphorylase (carboxylating)
VCGVSFVKEVFDQLDPGLRVILKKHEGDRVNDGDVIVTLQGRTRAMLTGERVALNYLSYLSAIATRTADFCEIIKPYPAAIMDTRKTTPGSRMIERFAVRCGGGVNHRFGLGHMVLIKDNHRAIHAKRSSLADVVRLAHKNTDKQVEIEVDSLTELEDVLNASPEMILLDNMPIAHLRKAVRLTKDRFKGKKRPLLEASGGINIKNVRQVAATGVDRISIGALTHSRKAIDMSLEIIDE